MEIEAFLRSTTALLTAVAVLLGAIVSLFDALRPLRFPPKLGKLLRTPTFLLGMVLITVALVIVIGRLRLPPLPLNAQLTTDAWNALNASEYPNAVSIAQECISAFANQALREQRALDGATPPPVGKVGEDEKQAIFSHGVLNDVATCYFIKGQALERLNRLSEARDAYIQAEQFSYARTWDEQGWFWSPAEAATDRLSALP